jgi:hypothetical protein
MDLQNSGLAVTNAFLAFKYYWEQDHCKSNDTNHGTNNSANKHTLTYTALVFSYYGAHFFTRDFGNHKVQPEISDWNSAGIECNGTRLVLSEYGRLYRQLCTWLLLPCDLRLSFVISACSM